MKAVISKSNCFVGTDSRFVTKEYKRLFSIIRIARAFALLVSHPVRVEVWYDWSNIYSSPDKIFTIEE